MTSALQYFNYLNILRTNDSKENQALLKSKKSLFTVLCLKFSRRKINYCYKVAGLKILNSWKYRSAALETLRSLNAAAKEIDKSGEIRQQQEQYLESLKSKKNLKYFLFMNFLPRNGQRTRTNAKTCKRLNPSKVRTSKRVKKTKKLVTVVNKNLSAKSSPKIQKI